ncbi:MAG: DinB family protein [Acidobacteriota bacterium]
MDNLSNTVANGFIFSYRDFAQRVHTLSENLTEEQFWRKPYPYGNSFGHLALHIIGNLNYYIGTEIAKTGYIRNREREFTETSPPSKAEVLKQLDEVIDLVVSTLERQTADSWSYEYKATGAESCRDRFSIFLRCASHFHHHVGQMIYLVKEISK